MNGVLTRIDDLLTRKGLRKIDLCNHLGLASSTYSTWRATDKIPDSKYLADIADFLGTTTDYLLTGQGDYYFDKDVQAMAQAIYDRQELKVLFDASRKLSKEDIEQFSDLMNRLAPKTWDY